MRPSSIPRSLGKEIRARRLEEHLSQEAFAHQAGLHTNMIGRIERGKGNPTLRTLIAISIRLDISLGELFLSASKR